MRARMKNVERLLMITLQFVWTPLLLLLLLLHNLQLMGTVDSCSPSMLERMAPMVVRERR